MSVAQNYSNLEKYLSLVNINGAFPQNTFCSLPILAQRGEHVFQALFLYNEGSNHENTIQRPFAWALLPLNQEPNFMFSWCQTMDFVPTEQYPLHSRVSSHQPGRELDPQTLTEYSKELIALTTEMIPFAFVKNLTAEEQEIIDRYKDLFLLLAHQGYYPYYQALSPEFFQWIGLILIDPKDEMVITSEHSLEDLENSVASLAQLFDKKIAYDAHKEKLFNQLHSELQAYKSGGYEKLTQSMERDVILVIDNIRRNAESIQHDSPTPAGYQHLLNMFDEVEQDLVDLLYRQGVDPYVVEGNKVDIPKQKVLVTIPTNNPDLDKVVAERLSQGWAKGERIVRPEYVQVYLYEPPAESSEPSDALHLETEDNENTKELLENE